MRRKRVLFSCIAMLIWLSAFFPCPAAAQSLAEQNEALFRELQRVHALSDGQMQSIRNIFSRSGFIGQGNPAIARHPVSPQGCREKLAKLGVRYENAEFEKICGAKYMAPLYDPKRQKAQDAAVCIDQFEFPDIPCAYPVVWVRAREAAEICRVVGKRLCDAHEWEGACAGALEAPDYRFDLARGVNANDGGRKDAAGPQQRSCRREGLGLWPKLSEGNLCRRKRQNARVRRRRLDGLRIQYLSRGELSGLSQRPAGL